MVETIFILAAFGALYKAYQVGVDVGRDKKADEYAEMMAAKENYYANLTEPIYHISFSPFDKDACARADYDRAKLASMGKTSIPVLCIPFGGVGLDGKAHSGELFNEYFIRVFREIVGHRNSAIENHAGVHGNDAANIVFTQQKMAGQRVGLGGTVDFEQVSYAKK